MEEVLYFHQRLRQHRATAKLTQQGAADALSITRQAYASYEEARAEPSIRVLLAMANLFGCSLDTLVGYCPDEPPRQLTQTKKRGRKPLMRRNPPPALSSLPSARPFVAWH